MKQVFRYSSKRRDNYFLLISHVSLKLCNSRALILICDSRLHGPNCLGGRYLTENQEVEVFSLHLLHTNDCLAKAFNLEPICLLT